MAYPFAPSPQWRKFISELAKDGVSQRRSSLDITDQDGEKVELVYLERTVDGETFRVPITYSNLDEIVQPTVLRSVCAALRVSPKIFGFILD